MINLLICEISFNFVVGININLGQSSICVKAILLTGVYDIPAKSDVLGFGSHRGPYACTKCLHPGEVIRTQKGNYCTFVYLILLPLFITIRSQLKSIP